MGEETDGFPVYEQDGLRFIVKDDGMLGSLTGFSIDYADGFLRKQIVVEAMYD